MSNDRFTLVMPSATVRYFGAGETCTDAQPGDILLVDHGTLVSDVIKVGQLGLLISEPELRGFEWCTHTAIMRSSSVVAEMGFGGYERRDIDTYRHRFYAVVHLNISDEQRATMLAFDDACRSLDYGWAQYVPIIIDGLTNGQFVGSWGDSIICSTHVALVAYAAGCFPDRRSDAIAPIHWAYWLGAVHPQLKEAA